MEKHTMWAVFGPEGKVRIDTLADSEAMSIHIMERGTPWRWQSMLGKGYSCKKVSVTITKI